MTAAIDEKLQNEIEKAKKDIEELKEAVENTIESDKPPEAAQKTAELLSSTNEMEFVEKDDHHVDVKWVIGLFLYLIGKKELVDLTNPENTWKNAKTFLNDIVVAGSIGSLIPNNPLQFTAEEVFEMRRYVKDNEEKLEIQHYKSLNPIAGLLVPFVKEAVEMAGVINPKTSHKYRDALFISDLYEKHKAKVAQFTKSIQ